MKKWSDKKLMGTKVLGIFMLYRMVITIFRDLETLTLKKGKKGSNLRFFSIFSKSYAPTENLHESNFVENLIPHRIVSHLFGAILNNEGARKEIKSIF